MAFLNVIRKSPAIAGLFLLLLLSGCATFKTPEEVAGSFWIAMADQNLAAVRLYVTEESRKELKSVDPRFKDAEAGFGEIRIKGANATIDTLLQFPKTDQPQRSDVSLTTVLRKEDGLWKVDYGETMATLPTEGPLGKLVDDLRNLGDQFSESLEGAMKELEKELPKLQKEAESMAEKLRKQMEQFSRELEEALKKYQEERKPEQAPDQHTI